MFTWGRDGIVNVFLLLSRDIFNFSIGLKKSENPLGTLLTASSSANLGVQFFSLS